MDLTTDREEDEGIRHGIVRVILCHGAIGVPVVPFHLCTDLGPGFDVALCEVSGRFSGVAEVVLGRFGGVYIGDIFDVNDAVAQDIAPDAVAKFGWELEKP